MTVNERVVRRGDVPVEGDDRVALGTAPPPPPPLPVVYEDEHLIVIDKPAGLLSIGTPRERERTAYRLLTAHARAARDGGRIFVVHRLDRETSGLLVFAKSVAVKRALQAQFAARSAERRYLAVVEGALRPASGTLTSRLTQDRGLRVRAAARGGRQAVTRYRVLRVSAATSLVELSLVTGRRGQIRAQLAALGHPIAGDVAYGSRLNPLRRLCLHATHLAFVHPRGRRVGDPRGGRVGFESRPPPGFSRL